MLTYISSGDSGRDAAYGLGEDTSCRSFSMLLGVGVPFAAMPMRSASWRKRCYNPCTPSGFITVQPVSRSEGARPSTTMFYQGGMQMAECPLALRKPRRHYGQQRFDESAANFAVATDGSSS
jgi:hypothetical protein